MTTLSTMRSRVNLQVGNKTNIDTTLNANINSAIYQLIGEMRPQEMWTEVVLKTNITTATPEYAFNASTGVWGSSQSTALTDVYALLMVRNDTLDVEIKRGSMRDYNRQGQDVTDSGNIGHPYRWTRNGNKFVLYNRIPDTTARTLTVTYIKRPAELSADADVFPLNREWERPVEILAAAMTWADLSEQMKASSKMTIYRDTLVNMDKPEAIEDEAPETQMVFISNPVQ